MIFSGMPGVSGAGSFLLGVGYFVSPAPVLPGNYSIEFSRIPNYQCVLSPKVPIALVVSITNLGVEFDPEILQSENTIPQT